MKTYELTLLGNQEDPEGNPIPYFRQTQRSTWTKGARRYNAWKGFVQEEFCKKFDGVRLGKPIPGIPRGRLSVDIEFRGEQHGDPDNVAKGLLDALFKNDKEMDVQTSHICRKRRGSVRIKIEMPDEDDDI